jgi:hypothetical protein
MLQPIIEQRAVGQASQVIVEGGMARFVFQISYGRERTDLRNSTA